MKDFIRFTANGIEAQFQVSLYEEGDFTCVSSPSLDIVGYGTNEAEAEESFREMLDIFLTDVREKRTTEQVLLSLGWSHQFISSKRFHKEAPSVSQAQFKRISIPAIA